MVRVVVEKSLAGPITEALRRVRRTSGVSLAFAGVVRDGSAVTLAHFVGRTSGVLDGLSVEAGHGLGGKVLRLNRPLAVDDYLKTPHITHRYNPAISAEGLRAVAAVPAIVDGRVVAVLYGGLHCENPVGNRLFDTLVGEARTLEQQVAVSRALIEADAGAGPDVDMLRDRMSQAYTRLRLLARTVDDAALADEIARITDVLLDEPALRVPVAVTLTPREQDVLALAALGYSNARIGGELGVSAETVKGYMKAAMGKLEAGTRLEAVVLARRAGLLPG
ncbi:LuxR C-terminal-related transcriptional regulator [Gordonia alkaliphila]|uniref:LuxR C-terminal-related transcriptional regulator n=1 Tax=Gordonia alkaliphila TaxID=1053547 RepID=UPI001FF2EDF9|nr:LuxR C-terminal-related transcriptional regulator [Gordonia alkaliphila]MCK0440871.1 LuxR C-terminal-related transcriptional regulator [Gordonia alkaliphila]